MDLRESQRSRVIGQKVLRPREQVEERLRVAILSGELKTGDLLPPEAELARQFNVSRTTVREALRSLTTQGMIYKQPGSRGGNFVQLLDHHSLGTAVIDSVHNLLTLGSIDFAEVAEMRQHLEIPAVRLAAANRGDEDVERLHDIVRRQKAASVDDPEVPKLDEQFHTLIAQASGNRVLASFVSALHHETEPVHYLDLSPEVGRATVRQHKVIVAAIEARDADAAEAAIVKHLTYLRRHLAQHARR
ncbi:FadR/GntR family transcriptional regulator [Amycolatopsis endophytica]|uniref:DNA-binding FadR family transcriptional regulator n=1 Tax=Amycolatopsis endophytica TaxID=860233 RepID=A0A853B8K9_9PSEU|nr:FadR/GntR family transcriptional regulator [Amycolatopsis endophytica]NYI91125.1 DNA-binding FadR family transcriptional regulator [Amycolatopsis endophytica]